MEIWGSTPDTANRSINGFVVNLTYNTDYFTTESLEYGPAFTEDQTGTIDDGAGSIGDVGATTLLPDVGDDEYVLLARAFFEPTDEDPGVPHDADRHYLHAAFDAFVSLDGGAVELADGGPVDVQVGDPPSTELWPVMYDIDDDGQVGFGDLAFFATAFGQNVGDPGAQFAWACDFDHSWKVDVGDLAFFAESFQCTPGDTIVYPPDFPDAWQSGTQQAAASAGFAAAENLQGSLHDLALEAYFDRSEADEKEAQMSHDALACACWLFDLDRMAATSSNPSDTKDVAEAAAILSRSNMKHA